MPDKLIVRLVVTSSHLSSFLQLPWTLYSNDANWVPPLRHVQKSYFNGKHPFCRHSLVQPFIATRGGRTVGRIAGIMSENHLEKQKEKRRFSTSLSVSITLRRRALYSTK